MDIYTMVKPEKDSIIVMVFGNQDVSEVASVYSDLVAKFPENNIIAIPDKDLLEVMDRGSTIEFLQAAIDSLRDTKEKE